MSLMTRVPGNLSGRTYRNKETGFDLATDAAKASLSIDIVTAQLYFDLQTLDSKAGRPLGEIIKL